MQTLELSNTLYYTFSTISQTLATGLGLLAAVVLFRLNLLDGKLSNAAQQLANQAGSNKLNELYETESWGDFAKCMREEVLPYRPHPFFKRWTKEIEATIATTPRIKAQLISTTQVTCGIIALSVITLVSTPFILKVIALPWFILALGVVFTVTALVKYYQLIKSIL